MHRSVLTSCYWPWVSIGSIEWKLESRPDLWCISSLSSWWTPFLFLIPLPHILSFDQRFIRRAGLQWGSALGAMTPISNPFRPEKDKTLVKALSKRADSNENHVHRSCRPEWELSGSRQSKNSSTRRNRTAASASRVELVKGVRGFSAQVCYAVSDGPRRLFVFLSSPRPTDKAQAEVWVTSSVKMCGIILLLLLSWQREDTWQMLFCSLMQAFVFLSNCFGICRMGLERREMCVFRFLMKGQISSWMHDFDCCTIRALHQKWEVIPPTTVHHFLQDDTHRLLCFNCVGESHETCQEHVWVILKGNEAYLGPLWYFCIIFITMKYIFTAKVLLPKCKKI